MAFLQHQEKVSLFFILKIMICILFYFKFILKLDVRIYMPVSFSIFLCGALLSVKKHRKPDVICDLNGKQIKQLDSIIWKQTNYFITSYIKVSFMVIYLNKNHTQKFGLRVSGRQSYKFKFIYIEWPRK